jgi:hypothetical protein
MSAVRNTGKTQVSDERRPHNQTLWTVGSSGFLVSPVAPGDDGPLDVGAAGFDARDVGESHRPHKPAVTFEEWMVTWYLRPLWNRRPTAVFDGVKLRMLPL